MEGKGKREERKEGKNQGEKYIHNPLFSCLFAKKRRQSKNRDQEKGKEMRGKKKGRKEN